jgi:hypothetical protein
VTEGSEDPYPRMTLAGEGHGPGGERWTLQAGGTSGEYHMIFSTYYPDGSRDGFGISGPVPPANSLWESAAGPARGGIQFFVWAHPRVRRVRIRAEDGEQCDLLPAKDDSAAGVVLFAALLPWASPVASEQAFDSRGQVLPDVAGLE